jgi:hypothetical protein
VIRLPRFKRHDATQQKGSTLNFPTTPSRLAMALALLGGLSTAAAQWIAFNDHYQGAQSHPRATFYVLAGNASFGPLRNLDTGNNLGATLSITNFNCTDSGFGAAFTGGPALATFGGFVDFTGNNIQLNGTNGVTGHTLSNLRTDARYNLKGTSNRGHASYTGRWTLFALVGAA